MLKTTKLETSESLVNEALQYERHGQQATFKGENNFDVPCIFWPISIRLSKVLNDGSLPYNV